MIHREKMTSVDTAWLRMDRPANRMMIVGVLMFEGAIDLERLKATIGARLITYRRFRQRVVVDESGAWWEDDPAFDLDRHVKRARLPGDAGKEALEAYAASRVSEPLDPSRPLWEITLLDNYRGGSALLSRIHHCIADGIALVGVMLNLTDPSPIATSEQPSDSAAPTAASNDAPDDATPPPAGDVETDFWKQLFAPLTAAAVRTIDYSGMAVTRSLEMLAQPDKATHYVRIGTAVATEIARLLAMPDDSPTRFKGKPGVAKAVAWSEPMDLDLVKAVGRVAGGSVNDVLLACVAGALRAYLLAAGDDPDSTEIRAMIPVNLRPPRATGDNGSPARDGSGNGALGNRFGLVALSLPLGIANPLARLATVRARMEALKDSYQAPVTLGVLGLVGMAPKALQTQVLDLLARKATAVMTNVPGPQAPIYLAGARLSQMMFWVPQSGDIGMGVSILSYNGGVQFGLVTDTSFVPDPARIVDRFQPEFEQLLLTVLQCPRGAELDADIAEQKLLGVGTGDGNGVPTRPGRKRIRPVSRARTATHSPAGA